MNSDHNCAGGYYPTTMWSEVERAGGADTEAASKALAHLLEQYYTPMRKHLMTALRVDEDRANDWVHDFVHERVLLGNFLQLASRSRGRFRTYLSRCLTHFALSQLRHESARRRRPEGGFVPLDDVENSASEPSEAPRSFDIDWARRTLELALNRMEAEYEARGWGNRWRLFVIQKLDPAMNGDPVPRYDQRMIEELGFLSPAEASNAIITAIRRLRVLVFEAVSDYTGTPAETKLELRALMNALSDGPTSPSSNT